MRLLQWAGPERKWLILSVLCAFGSGILVITSYIGIYRLMDAVLAECEKKKKNSLILRSKDGITRIDLQQLEYCEVLGRKLLFHLGNGAVLESAGSLDDLAGQLMQYSNVSLCNVVHQRLRPHRSFLVNMEYIQNISSRSIKMVNDAEIPIPHGKCSEIKNTYMEYAFNGEQAVL